MPWSLLRPSKTQDSRALRRYSTIDPPPTRNDEPLGPPNPPENTDHLRQGPRPANKAPSPLRMSFEPESVHDAGSAVEPSHAAATQEPLQRRQRFSMLVKRHVSDPQISKTARAQSDFPVPPIPQAPSIITTAPTDSFERGQTRNFAHTLPHRQKAPELPRTLSSKKSQKSLSERSSDRGQHSGDPTSANPSARESRLTFEEPDRIRGLNPPPAYGDDSSSSLALPASRLSESSRSDGSLGDQGVYATTTTTHTVSTTTTFFRLPRRKKNKGPLFPLPVKITQGHPSMSNASTPRESTHASSPDFSGQQSPTRDPPATAIHRPFHAEYGNKGSASPLPSPTRGLASSRESTSSAPSLRSSPGRGSSMPPRRRGRSSTKGSSRLNPDDDDPLPTPPLPNSTRTSSSTMGRSSIGGLFNLSRLRQNSEPQTLRQTTNHPPMPGTPLSVGSKSHSFTLPREHVLVPERLEGDTPAKYLIRLEEAVNRGAVATILSQSNDEFFKNVLRSYMRGFKFFGDPLDMSTRKLLMEVDLPKETQQIDRVLQAFANRYHECNPGVYASPDEAYFIAFSILILHTDVFNKNNKNKMQKHDYTRNASGQGVAEEILQCFYDNISYTPFIHVEDDVDLNGERIIARKPKKNLFTKQSTDPSGRPSREPVDPYTLILDDGLEILRPPLKDVMDIEDHYTYLGTAPSFNLKNLHTAFFKFGVLQIVSSRSRPEAFSSPETMANPADAHPGVVDIKVTKVGILWRKELKKKKGRSPWQEWGAILTGAQLYFFRNSSWVRNLMHQHDHHHKHGLSDSPVVFKPPLEQFKPDVMMSTEDSVALLDTTYKKHKNALLFIKHGGLEETLLADTEAEMNDWLAKLNYAAAFRTAGVRMRGLIGGNTVVPKTRGMRRMNSDNSAHCDGKTSGEMAVQVSQSDAGLSQQIQAARRQIMAQKISEGDEKLRESGKHLEAQLRNARHLQILAPIQNKTREQVVLAAGGMAAKIKWSRLEIWRTKCHRDILAMDLEEDLKSEGLSLRTDLSAGVTISQTPPRRPSRTSVAQDSLATPTRFSKHMDDPPRPSTQPSPAKSFTIDDVFVGLQESNSTSNHKPKGSWELPPLSFQPTRSSLTSGSSNTTTQSTRQPPVPQPPLRSVSDTGKTFELSEMATKLVTPAPATDNNEQEVLKEAGVVDPNNISAAKPKRPETPEGNRDQEVEKPKSPEYESGEGRSKVRRSLHRTLRENAHVPSHHRSKKGKDSGGSSAFTEDNASLAESEGLARTTGSFTVHGKKASVITFGSEWQGMSPEERLNLRKQSVTEGSSRLSVPATFEDEGSSIRSTSNRRGRPISAVSMSTTASKSQLFEEALEEPMRDDKSKGEVPASIGEE